MPPPRDTATGPLDAGAVLRLREGLAWQDVGGEVVILDLDGMVLRGLNPSGGRVFQLIDGHRTLAAVAREIAAAYGIGLEQALADVRVFAESMAERGLIEVVGSAAPPPGSVPGAGTR